MRRRLAVVLGTALVAGVLAGCAPEPVPAFTPPPIPEYAPPAVTADRAHEILEAIETVIAEGDASADADALSPRVTGPALEIRRSEYALQSATEGSRLPQSLWTDSDVTVITATDSWPRSILAVSNSRPDSTVRLYLGLVQDGPRDPYRLVAWSRLLPGVTTPTFASAEIGSAPVAADEAGLAQLPADALTHLADAFTNPESEYTGEFEADRFREFLANELAGLRSGIEVAGEVSSSSTAGPVVFAIGTADGGAVVMGTIDTTVTLRKTISGAELTLAGEMASLGGTGPVAAAANATYRQMVTVYVPPAGTDAKLQLLGAERVLASVERVD